SSGRRRRSASRRWFPRRPNFRPRKRMESRPRSPRGIKLFAKRRWCRTRRCRYGKPRITLTDADQPRGGMPRPFSPFAQRATEALKTSRPDGLSLARPAIVDGMGSIMHYRIELSRTRKGFARVQLPGREIAIEAKGRAGPDWEVLLTDLAGPRAGSAASGTI